MKICFLWSFGFNKVQHGLQKYQQHVYLLSEQKNMKIFFSQIASCYIFIFIFFFITFRTSDKYDYIHNWTYNNASNHYSTHNNASNHYSTYNNASNHYSIYNNASNHYSTYNNASNHNK